MGGTPSGQPPLATPLERGGIPSQPRKNLEQIVGQLDVVTLVSYQLCNMYSQLFLKGHLCMTDNWCWSLIVVYQSITAFKLSQIQLLKDRQFVVFPIVSLIERVCCKLIISLCSVKCLKPPSLITGFQYN